jgi:hypothetical protein
MANSEACATHGATPLKVKILGSDQVPAGIAWDLGLKERHLVSWRS